eukprot:TRINITY_DN3098_c0_g1_i2.p1 TRINITY_DN3098_c0_g1~~TRINITY_DN3098_c0_g1_i2.p1  ORF type:complete len:260 (-),score=58.98 TRINITY_DN3098_c0_g1_i2:941-1633(-)
MEQQNNKSTEADKLKEEANKQFGRGRYSEALELYSKAIELVNDNAILYSNRAFCHIKLENYGSAIADATKSIELDPKYIKGYYRRGTANLALAKYKLALTDFKKVVQIAPNEKDAVSKLQECDKAVRRAAFEAAIAHESTASPFDTLDLNLEIESSYDGPHLPNPITLEFIQQMMLHFKDQKKIHKKYPFFLFYLSHLSISLLSISLISLSHLSLSHISLSLSLLSLLSL